MTERELVDETIEYYRTHPRGVMLVNTSQGKQTNACFYYTSKTGAMCAVGRCMVHPEYFADCSDDVSSINLTDELKNQYSNIRIEFWQALQEFHDEEKYWKTNLLHGNDLTTLGELRRDELYQLP